MSKNPLEAFLSGINKKPEKSKFTPPPEHPTMREFGPATIQENTAELDTLKAEIADGRQMKVVSIDGAQILKQLKEAMQVMEMVLIQHDARPESLDDKNLWEDLGYAHGVLNALGWVIGQASYEPMEVIAGIWVCQDPTCEGCSNSREKSEKNRTKLHATLRENLVTKVKS